MSVEKDADYERYLRLRDVSRKLTLELSRHIQKKEIHRCGKDLGLLRKKTLVCNSEDWAIDAVETILRKYSQPIESGNLSHTQANSLGEPAPRAARCRAGNRFVVNGGSSMKNGQ